MAVVKKRSGPNPVDIHVGQRVKQQRNLLGLSQERLGEMLGVTFQQIQKYERGANRISASSLFMISKKLAVSVSYFFEGMPIDGAASAANGFGEPQQEGLSPDFLGSKDCIELNRAFARISDPKARRNLVEMAKSLANANSGPAHSAKSLDEHSISSEDQ